MMSVNNDVRGLNMTSRFPQNVSHFLSNKKYLSPETNENYVYVGLQ